MRSLPAADPGVPDSRSAVRYLLWVARKQGLPLPAGIAFAILWWLGQALAPAALGNGIDSLTAHDPAALVRWSLALLALGVLQAYAGIMRHRSAVYVWLSAAYRTVQVTVRQATRLGATLPRRLSTGEVVAVGTSDIAHIGNAMDILLRGTGAVVTIVTVTVIMLTTSVPLGLTVLIGVPLMAAAIGPLLRPLHRRQHRHRDLEGDLTTRGADIVAGLRVLRGIGGEDVFARLYRAESQRVRHAGVRVASVESTLEGAQVLLPGLLIALVTWLGARFALDGGITAGQLVSFYAYAVFLIAPLRTLTEAADKLTRGLVAARRVVHILNLKPDIEDAAPGAVPRANGVPMGDLADPASGVRLRQGVLTALAAAVPEDAAAIADRLGRYTPGEVTIGGVPLADLPLAEVRRRILVADNDARLFTGSLREALDIAAGSVTLANTGLDETGANGTGPTGAALPDISPEEAQADEISSRGNTSLASTHVAADANGNTASRDERVGSGVSVAARDRDGRIREALRVASAEDIVEALPNGLDEHVAESGREFSGGQRQRLRLARALLADPEVLILVEPTSAVDAHTEARVAERLAAARRGRTTLVCTTSPLVLDRADHVIYVEDGRARSEGRHRDLLARDPRYAATVTRGED
ncbi:ABC transporter ATP-binding protein [Thermopolyspora sp. NPDC052614]|uniref:ABC transporter ATP-binding protein n=1 Tax=Thermopolyspora sp. NPDC052614 TaxID=3155682 RepID=UPI00343738E1